MIRARHGNKESRPVAAAEFLAIFSEAVRRGPAVLKESRVDGDQSS
jgi:hypothetical protein